MLNISHYKIIAIGKVKKKWIQSGIKIYLNRLPGLKVIEIKDSNKKKEALDIKAILKKDEIFVTLNENGQSFTSREFARKLQNCSTQNITFAIGGATGFSHEILSASSWDLSLSSLTFPHELAQLILLEQIYRAKTIAQGTPYHKD